VNLSGAALTIEGLRKHFGPAMAVDGVSVDLVAGEHLALIGPSGCGKSTMLLLIAGLLRPDGGTVRIGDRTVADAAGAWVEPDRRRVGMVFQDYALFPHLTVAANIAFGLDRLPRSERAARVAEVLGLVSLEDLSGRYPHELSSGQQQRVALARSLAPEPDVILLDEPFSNLDRALRDNLRAETKRVLRRAGATAVLVTHDHSEALGFGDRVAVMRAGRLLQVGAPEEVFELPDDSFVAEFLGVADFLPAQRVDERTVLSDLGALGPLPVPASGTLSVMVRPHELTFEPDPGGRATVTGREYQGTSTLYELTLDSGERLASRQAPEVAYPLGTRVRPKAAEGKVPVLFCDGRRIWPPVPHREPPGNGDHGLEPTGEDLEDGVEMGVCAGGGDVVGGGLRQRQPGGRGQEPG
jgi:iron(III) transport system ATP-binding protein